MDLHLRFGHLVGLNLLGVVQLEGLLLLDLLDDLHLVEFLVLEYSHLLIWLVTKSFIIDKLFKLLVIGEGDVVADALKLGERRTVIHEELPLRRHASSLVI